MKPLIFANPVCMLRSLKDEVNAIIEAGYYNSKPDIINDALRHLLNTKGNLKFVASIEMYKKGKISIGRAAEVAGMTVVEYKEALAGIGIDRYISVEVDELKKSDELMR